MPDKSRPVVSVGVITYNHEHYIRQCLEGILMQQTNFDFEVIVGEDCSTDGTRAIVQEFETRYPGRIKPVYHAQNVGGARNAYEFCYPLLTGKYIAICEGDDYWTDPLKLQKQVDFLESHPDYIMCFHHANQVNQHDEVIQTKKPAEKIVHYKGKDLFHLNIPTLSLVFRNIVSSIPQEILEAKCGDAFLRGMLAAHGRGANLGFVGAHYRVHPGGLYSSKTVVEQFRLSIHARKMMRRSAYFNREQKKEIEKELLRRKALYMMYFIRKNELLNCLKIAFT